MNDCTCETGACLCRGTHEQAREERALMARESRTEHEVLTLLRGVPIDASPRAVAFAGLLCSQPSSGNGTRVRYILITSESVHWWTPDGHQHCAQLDARRAVRLVA